MVFNGLGNPGEDQEIMKEETKDLPPIFRFFFTSDQLMKFFLLGTTDISRGKRKTYMGIGSMKSSYNDRGVREKK